MDGVTIERKLGTEPRGQVIQQFFVRGKICHDHWLGEKQSIDRNLTLSESLKVIHRAILIFREEFDYAVR